MSIAFTTVVSEPDLDSSLPGWRCPVLKIPGAKIDGIYAAGRRIDPDWYVVMTDLNVVRWVHDVAPPDKATLSIVLTQALSTLELTTKWKQLAIVLPVIGSLLAAVLSALVTLGTQKGKTEPPPSTSAKLEENHLWHIMGRVESNPAFSQHDVSGRLQPPTFPLAQDWTFNEQVPIEKAASGLYDFPTITFSLVNKARFNSPVVHIFDPKHPPPQTWNVVDYEPIINEGEHFIELKKPIEFQSEASYAPRQRPQQKPAPAEPSTAAKPTGG